MNRKQFLAVTAGAILGAAASVRAAEAAGAAQAGVTVAAVPVANRRVKVDGRDIFFREAGEPRAPVVLLLHGFPNSSFYFRTLIPLLADRYRLIAPDLPGFGFSDQPDRASRPYSFARVAQAIEGFTHALGLDRFAIYIFDYGAPAGLRLALARPEAVGAIISQNGNAYREGLGAGWNPIQKYWQDPSEANRSALRPFLTAEAIKEQYTYGTPAPDAVPPEAYTLDAALIQRTGNIELQLDLFLDYASNVALYPRFQEFLRTRRPPMLAIWGKNDPFFVPEGAQAYTRDVPDAEVRLLETGHFALETHPLEIAAAVRDFLDRRPPG
jgi:pimeloyl-ACP methyl ester carboxylesterase